MTTQPATTSEPLHGPSDTENRPEKRGAEDSLASVPSKRSQTSKISSALLLCQPPPHPLSVNGLLRKHCRERLYVKPLQWTARHLELLGYRFFRQSSKELKDHGHQRRQQNSLGPPSEGRIRDAIYDVQRPNVGRDYKNCRIVGFLVGCEVIRLARSGLPFDFKRQTITKLRTNGTYSPGSKTASLAYFDLERIKLWRNESIRFTWSKKVEGPVLAIKRKKQHRIQPPNEAEDPYIVAVLIALAQGLQRQHQDKKQSVDKPNECLESDPTKPDPAVLSQQTATEFEVHVLALSKCGQSLYFYTANIPSISLDMWNEPSQFHNTNVVVVSYKVIRIRDCQELIQNIKDIISSL
ncbi:hypothetical protein GGR51DRAFT_542346 [Nemania sp. FL0031]|nr:hypothetical protein GGR51DRAFT_542346 [Nemania sp. FL0031]